MANSKQIWYNDKIELLIKEHAMAGKHIAEVLIEANKKISTIIDKIQTDDMQTHKKNWIEDLNEIIRKLDHIVEDLEK